MMRRLVIFIRALIDLCKTFQANALEATSRIVGDHKSCWLLSEDGRLGLLVGTEPPEMTA